ncbi:hypothetical protein M3J09_009627 [Ascochyta lentis]
MSDSPLLSPPHKRLLRKDLTHNNHPSPTKCASSPLKEKATPSSPSSSRISNPTSNPNSSTLADHKVDVRQIKEDAVGDVQRILATVVNEVKSDALDLADELADNTIKAVSDRLDKLEKISSLGKLRM